MGLGSWRGAVSPPALTRVYRCRHCKEVNYKGCSQHKCVKFCVSVLDLCSGGRPSGHVDNVSAKGRCCQSDEQVVRVGPVSPGVGGDHPLHPAERTLEQNGLLSQRRRPAGFYFTLPLDGAPSFVRG